MSGCAVYYLHELNIGQGFWYNGELFTLLDDRIFRGCMRCKRFDGAIAHVRKDACVVPEWYQQSLF